MRMRLMRMICRDLMCNIFDCMIGIANSRHALLLALTFFDQHVRFLFESHLAAFGACARSLTLTNTLAAGCAVVLMLMVSLGVSWVVFSVGVVLSTCECDCECCGCDLVLDFGGSWFVGLLHTCGWRRRRDAAVRRMTTETVVVASLARVPPHRHR